MNELQLLTAIAERYEQMDVFAEDRMTTVMDLEVTQKQFPEGNLEVLLNLSDGDFAHDLFGIKRHINRREMMVEGCFVPRFVGAS